jgi:hypothetical protein
MTDNPLGDLRYAPGAAAYERALVARKGTSLDFAARA